MNAAAPATIFAPATAAGPAGLQVVRVSGSGAAAAFHALSGQAALPPARRAVRVALSDAGGRPLDRGLALWFPAPASFTGEDVLELHLHGGRAVLAGTLEALAALPGLRLAEPGEFSRRAFEHGKLDLTEVEAIADLVAAETEAQRLQALRQLGGELGLIYEGWRSRLMRALAHIEAEIDFPEEDLPQGLLAALRPEVAALSAEIASHLGDNRRGERLRNGVSVAILGRPNAGKSSFLNVLAKRDVAIVTAKAGTTRDVIEVHLDLGGLPVILADTAGIHAGSDDPIEREGIRRAKARAAEADLRVVLLDAADWPNLPRELEPLLGPGSLLVVNKVDLRPLGPGPLRLDGGLPAYPLSVRTGEGLPQVLEALRQAVAASLGGGAGNAPLTRARHRQALEDCRASLSRALAAPEAELAAEDLRLAARALGRITGRVGVEDTLDIIFREFCIGK